MFNLNFGTLFSTIGIGAIVALLIAYFYFLFVRLLFRAELNEGAFSDWFKSTVKREYGNTGQGLMLALVLYGLGILAEDLSSQNKDSDLNQPFFSEWLFLMPLLIESETELRRNTLLTDSGTLNHLGQELAGNPYLRKAACLRSSFSEQALSEPAYVNQLYYAANNFLIMRTSEVRKDLIQVQERVAFSRSLLHISFYSFCLLLIIYTTYIIREVIRPGGMRFRIETRDEFGNVHYLIKAYYLRRSFFIVAVIVVSSYTLRLAETTYNEKVFGTYSSMLYQLHSADTLFTKKLVDIK